MNTYEEAQCQQCGDPCKHHPYLCERHRPQMEKKTTSKFAAGLLVLGNNQPALIRDIELVTHRYERQPDESYMTGTLMRDRRIYKARNHQPGRIFRTAVFTNMQDTDGVARIIKMKDVLLRVNSCTYTFGYMRYQYDIKLDITEWYLSEDKK